MRNKFERELIELNESLIKMGALIESAISKAIVSIREQSETLAEEVRLDEQEVDDLEKEIEARCMRILLSQQPVARDLRAISTALKMITDMERIADQAVDIADISMHFLGKNFIKNPTHISKMAECCVIMVKESVNSFVTGDLELANKVIDSDDEVDELFVTVRNELISLLREDVNNSEQAIDFLMIAKYLERIADHAVNIAEWVVFNITGQHKNYRIM